MYAVQTQQGAESAASFTALLLQIGLYNLSQVSVSKRPPANYFTYKTSPKEMQSRGLQTPDWFCSFYFMLTEGYKACISYHLLKWRLSVNSCLLPMKPWATQRPETVSGWRIRSAAKKPKKSMKVSSKPGLCRQFRGGTWRVGWDSLALVKGQGQGHAKKTMG